MQVNVPATIAQSGGIAPLLAVPEGIGSESTTPAGTCDGPLFVTVMV